MVYKGCERKIIMIKNTGSEFFEEAYFILREKHGSLSGEQDMIKEANRLVNENTVTAKVKKKKKLSMPCVYSFSFGMLAGFFVFCVIFAVVK